MNNEQWKAGGKCNVCRRQNYCRSLCKAAMNRQQYELECMVRRAFFRGVNKERGNDLLTK